MCLTVHRLPFTVYGRRPVPLLGAPPLRPLHLARRRQNVVHRLDTHVGLPAVTGIVGVVLHVGRTSLDETRNGGFNDQVQKVKRDGV